MDTISDPHDAYFKSTFGQIEMAKDFIDNYLPEELKEIINIDTLDYEPNSFLNEELKNQFGKAK